MYFHLIVSLTNRHLSPPHLRLNQDVKDDMKDMMNSEMRQVQHIHEEIRDVLNKADDKFDETTRKMESYIQTKVSEVSSQKMFKIAT